MIAPNTPPKLQLITTPIRTFNADAALAPLGDALDELERDLNSPEQRLRDAYLTGDMNAVKQAACDMEIQTIKQGAMR